MKVLVTGATSGLGRNAVEFLRNKGISVRATGRNEAMGKLLQKMGAEFVHADLTELVSSQAKVMLAGIDTLWHCSSFTSPWGTQEAFDLARWLFIRFGKGDAKAIPVFQPPPTDGGADSKGQLQPGSGEARSPGGADGCAASGSGRGKRGGGHCREAG